MTPPSQARAIALTSTSLSDQTVPGIFGENAASAPVEIFREIFVHLQNSYNEYRRLNAFCGIVTPLPDDRVWNPVGLQLVCRRWRGIAQPLYYNDQVALECTAKRGTVELICILDSNLNIPVPRSIVLMVTDDYAEELVDLKSLRRRQGQTDRLKVLASTPADWDPMRAVNLVSKLAVCSSSSCVISPRDSPKMIRPRSPSPRSGKAKPLGTNQHKEMHVVEPLLLTFRLANAAQIGWATCVLWSQLVHSAGVRRIFKPHVQVETSCVCPDRVDTVCLPHLRIETPFALPEAICNKLEPLLGLRQVGSTREALRLRQGRVQQISFGVASDEEATMLRAEVDALGLSNLVVMVDVLQSRISV